MDPLERSLWKKGFRKFTSREGRIGDYGYLYLFTPILLFVNGQREPIFFGLTSQMPVVLDDFRSGACWQE